MTEAAGTNAFGTEASGAEASGTGAVGTKSFGTETAGRFAARAEAAVTRPVTVGVDGSAGSLTAVEWAGAEALSRGVPLWLVCARKPPAADEWQPWPQEQLHAAHRLATRLYPSLRITEDAVCEAPATALINAAGEADVLALGSHGLAPAAGYFLGPVGLSVLAHAHRPVVAVRGRMQDPAGAEARPVVAAVDLRPGTDDVLEFAFRTAAAQGRALKVVHARSPAPPPGGTGGSPLPGAPAGAGGSGLQVKQTLGRLLHPWRERFREVDTEIWTEDEAVVPYLLEAGADAALTAVGRRIRGHPFPTRIGPVIHALLHHSPRPVAVIPHT